LPVVHVSAFQGTAASQRHPAWDGRDTGVAEKMRRMSHIALDTSSACFAVLQDMTTQLIPVM